RVVEAEPALVPGRNSVTMAIAVGRAPPSPTPARKRQSVNRVISEVKASSRVNTENAATEKIITRRRPSLSVRKPMVNAPIIMPTRPRVEIRVAWGARKDQEASWSMAGMVAARRTRSKLSRRVANQRSDNRTPTLRVGAGVVGVVCVVGTGGFGLRDRLGGGQ